MKKRFSRKGLNIFVLLLFTLATLQVFNPETSLAQSQPNVVAYPVLIQQADQAFAANDYPTALMLYAKANYAKPELPYASSKITEINALLDSKPDSRALLFEDIILKAEKLFEQKAYPQAKLEYQKALAIDPSAQFPKDRLGLITAVYTDPSDQAYFNDAVANGDKALAASDFDKAVLFYETALAVKPDAKTVKEKITNTRKQKEDFKVRAAQSAKIITAADKLLAADKRVEARTEYQKALDLTPENPYAKQKIAEIDRFDADKKAVQDAYDKAVELADQFYINRDFANARLKYQEALTAKPQARYPKEMLDKTKNGESLLQSDQQKYDAALASAESLLANGDYEAALIGFKSVLAIKPSETYPKSKITEIEKLLTERTTRKEAYDIAIKNGDQSLGEKKFAQSISHYRNALSLMPGEKYPAQKIEEINNLLAQQKGVEENYTKAIAEADKLFAQKKYTESITGYTSALAIKPGETYPQQRISEAQNLLSSARNNDENYTAAISTGDKLFGEQKYEEALAEYKKALAVKPSEKYPKDKSLEINTIITKLKTDSDKYAVAIANGDKALASANFSVAITSYQEALRLKPTEQYPKDKITETNLAIANRQKTDEQYTTALNTGDKLFSGKEYDLALTAYTEAGNLKKNEKYPQDQIAKINKLLAEMRSADENYTQSINDGDRLFSSANYSEAVIFYKKAATIKPSETYAKSQIEKINTLLEGQKKLEIEYNTAVSAGDKFFGTKNFEECIISFRKASELKPSEKYPLDKIAEAEKLIANRKTLIETYTKALSDGDKFFSEKDLTQALTAFTTASDLQPSEAYPKQKIAEIQSILDKNKAEGQRYQEAIALADKLFTDQKFAQSLETYKRATTIKPSEEYPQSQVVKIEQLLTEQKKLDDEYQKLITEANSQFKIAGYEEARMLYSKAEALKPTEKLPKDKIAEIDGIVAGIQKKELEYSNAISEGDELTADKKYTSAIASYTKALSVKPSESYPEKQIKFINSLVAEQKKVDDQYLSFLTSGDQSLEAKKYSEAITDYRKALVIKPMEKYPSERIADAEKQIADSVARQLTYDKAIAEGDKKMQEKAYENALALYNEAKTARPSEPYPGKKITEIQNILNTIKAENERYDEALVLADKFFADAKYLDALEPYQRATTIKPNEKYPQEQIARINGLLAELEKINAEYQNLLSDAESRLTDKKYEDARGLLIKASAIKPAESLPKTKIAEIDKILADIALNEQNYSKAIQSAADQYSAKDLPAAVKSYQEALLLKPDEKFPQERIAAIKTEIKTIDDQYSKAIAEGDKKLEAKELMEALNAYQNALEIKPSEDYPKNKISEINSALAARKEEQEKMYISYIADGDRLLNTKEYPGAKSAFTKATGIKPSETYPKQKIVEIDKIIEEILLARRAEYTKALGEADKLYNTKIYDQAIDAYETAALINPEDSYPEQQISKIRKYLVDHAIQDLYSQTLLISEGNEKKFTFSAIEQRLRKNNYILLKARSAGAVAPKVYLNYGKDAQKNGGIVLRSLDKKTISDYLIRISVQDKWYREDNNWISLFVETGDIEITKVQIAAGDE